MSYSILCYFLDDASLFTESWNTEIMMIMMMIAMAMMIIIKGTSSIFVVIILLFFEVQLSSTQGLKWLIQFLNKNKTPVQAAHAHYAFKQCISSVRQNPFSSP